MLEAGTAIAIGPLLSMTSCIVQETDDAWTLAGARGNLSAQLRHRTV